MELLKEFEELIKKRTVVFHHDDEDGFFIKVTGKGMFDTELKLADMKHRVHGDIYGAIQAAVDWMTKNDKDFAEKLAMSI